jgi:hypothetical protein
MITGQIANESTSGSIPRVVSQLDADGYFLAAAVADPSPQESGVFLIPGGAVVAAPPEQIEAGKAYRFGDNGWDAFDDHRQQPLYRTTDGARYVPGLPGVDGAAAYVGVGPLPGWLTLLPRPDAWSVWSGDQWGRDEDAWLAAQRAAFPSQKNERLTQATSRIAILQDAVDLGLATAAEETSLREWRAYRVAVSRLEAGRGQIPDWPPEPVNVNPPA